MGQWGRGTFNNRAESLRYHLVELGEEVGAGNVWQYMRKAKSFKQNLHGAGKAYLDNGRTRYMKSGQYITLDQNGKIVSYGLQ